MTSVSSKPPSISPPFRALAFFGGIFSLLLLIIFQFYGFFPKEYDLGPTAEVRFTPYHTAGELLKLDNKTVEHFRNLKSLDKFSADVDSLIISAKPGHINQARFDTLINWVEDGGQLIYWVNRKQETDTDLILNYLDAQLFKDKIAAKDKEVEKILEISEEVLPTLGNLVEMVQKPRKVVIANPKTFAEVEFDTSWHLRDWSESAFYFNDPNADYDRDHILEYAHGDGYIILLSDMNFWLNPNIERHDHGYFLQTLIGDNKTIWFMFGGELESAFTKLKKQAMPLFWAFVVFLIFWLWRQIPRLGPKLALNLVQRRNIGEHIQASAQMRWQQSQQQQWLDAIQLQISKQAAKRNPNFHNLKLADKIHWLAQVTEVKEDAVANLFTPVVTQDLSELQFLELMDQLQQMKKRL